MHSEFDPDDNFAHSFAPGTDVDEEAALEALVWQLLLLVNPEDGEAARAQFDAWQEGVAMQADVEPLDLLREATDWRSAFFVEDGDTRGLVECLDELAAQRGLRIDWGVEDPTDDDFLDGNDVPGLVEIAFDRLREHHWTLWTFEAGELQAGWITRSREDEALRLVAAALGIPVRPGGG